MLKCFSSLKWNVIESLLFILLFKDYFIESDIDSELMVIIPFIETVRIKVINIIAYEEGSSPNLLQVYINK